MRALPLKLFMTADAVGGVFTYALDLLRRQTRLGVRATLAVLGPGLSEAQLAAARAVDGLDIIETGLPLDWLASSPQEILSTAEQVAALARNSGADLVHLNTPTCALASFDAPVVCALHSCLASWWASVEGGALPQDFVWRTQMLRDALRRADAVICPSRAYAARVCDLYRIAPFVVHNGRAAPTPPAFPPPAAPAFAFSAGRLWDRGKNAATLDEAAGEMRLPLLLAGPCASPQGERFSARRARLTGALEAPVLRQILSERPVFLSAALYEPFGLSVLEAAQAGCPLVLSDIETFRELWQGAALFAPPRLASAFAANVNRIVVDGDLREELRKAAMRRAQTYSAAAMAEATMAIYRAALARNTGAVA
ncbi:glycosyltransferase involved in cell wall biosynthesis [Rhodoblastus acidophilus]|uniref:glycosyltransferase family 4 protein n=1 Tax=Rhodoblastus acidophilus TaxID=1074 RepID=UPI00222491B1|nr:glycosyltransferase family 4 protein [Rhodoblastus acidophilus]MCW2285348.1 glycosyltransferase involved in cell wall biosynthesis [Rhodoblastus acidophilus]MCW2334304.1 glycosyltransferase involved in cell wall biosynthesis [Rhodoblastus acidophilus]